MRKGGLGIWNYSLRMLGNCECTVENVNLWSARRVDLVGNCERWDSKRGRQYNHNIWQQLLTLSPYRFFAGKRHFLEKFIWNEIFTHIHILTFNQTNLLRCVKWINKTWACCLFYKTFLPLLYEWFSFFLSIRCCGCNGEKTSKRLSEENRISEINIHNLIHTANGGMARAFERMTRFFPTHTNTHPGFIA